MAELVLFNGRVPSSFTPSKFTTIVAKKVTLRFLVTVTGSPTELQWYLEFGGDKSTWFRETAEEDQGDGDVQMPTVIRTVTLGGANLPVGTTAVSMQFQRDEQLFRVQLKCAGTATVKLTTPYGNGAH
jgi:hypothetical protein